MTEIVPFEFEKHTLRGIADKDGNPWIVATDVGNILELTNVNESLKNIPKHYRDAISITDSSGKSNRMTIISEAGFYMLVFRSRKPGAEKFTHWVASEVLPTIRKTGSYSINQSTVPTTINNQLLALTQNVNTLTKNMNALTAIVNGLKQYVDNRLRYVIDQQIEKIAEEKAIHYTKLLHQNAKIAIDRLKEGIVEIQNQSNQAIIQVATATNLSIEEFIAKRGVRNVSRWKHGALGRKASVLAKKQNPPIKIIHGKPNKYPESFIEQLFIQENIPFDGGPAPKKAQQITH